MDDTTSAVIMAPDNDLVQVTAMGRLFLVTRGEFERIAVHSRMIDEMMYRDAKLSDIRHVFDDAAIEPETVTRFEVWIATNRPSETNTTDPEHTSPSPLRVPD
ncbi:MAG: hypothetical protein HY018_13365 [Hydrogenophilales bacterium]|nr:hypothetical protein [Hydrogenophilales bacterium]